MDRAGGNWTPNTPPRARTPHSAPSLTDLLENYVGSPDAALFCGAPDGKTRRRENLSQAGRTCSTPARTRSTTPSARSCSHAAWASAASSRRTGAGQHGVATATVAARFRLRVRDLHGAVDMERQALNVARMRFLGAKVVPVTAGQATLKEAVNESHARLGDECPQHALHPRHSLWRASVSHDGARFFIA